MVNIHDGHESLQTRKRPRSRLYAIVRVPSAYTKRHFHSSSLPAKFVAHSVLCHVYAVWSCAVHDSFLRASAMLKHVIDIGWTSYMVHRTAPFSITLKEPIPRFQGQAIFDAEYLQNGCRYGHSYYGRRIGNHTQAFEWHQFQWPWETSKLVFKVTILFNVK